MLPVRPADMLSAVFAFSFLVPKLQLGNADVSEALLPKWDRIGRRQRSWSFEDKFIPKLELGNEVGKGSGRGRLRRVVAIEILDTGPGIKDNDAIVGRNFPSSPKLSERDKTRRPFWRDEESFRRAHFPADENPIKSS